MSIYDSMFPLGFGTNRLPVKGADDAQGFKKSVQLMLAALEAGVTYVDVASNYSRGIAEAVCKEAFSGTSRKPQVTIKCSYLSDTTADDALRRSETVLTRLGLSHAFCFVCWNVSSFTQFQEIMRPGGVYEGARKAKDAGMVEHICFSTHAPPEDILKILEESVFEGITISFSVLNSIIMRPVLQYAEEKDVGVVVMNPLGGGVIPQNGDYFRFLRGPDDESVSQAALRYVSAHRGVKITLSGFNSLHDLYENIACFKSTFSESPADRIGRIDGALRSVSGFCTGCRYCNGCPKGVPVYELMQSYNTTLFPAPHSLYGRTDPSLLETIGICASLKNTFNFLPQTPENPCVRCGRCEKKCTAHLPIMNRVENLYRRFESSGFARESMISRLRETIGEKRKIAFYPGGGYTAFVLSLLEESFPHTAMDISIFDSSPHMWGNSLSGYRVENPAELPTVNPELVVVSNYSYSEEIYQMLRSQLKGNIPVKKLHKTNDVPWVF